MGNNQRSFGAILLLCLLILPGCEARHDIPTDPANTPVVVPQDIAYNDQNGAVAIRWEYLGINPVERFRLIRLEREGLHLLNWVSATLPREISKRSDVWDMENAVDARVNAGEDYRYIIRAENIHGAIVEAPAGGVQIPGAYIHDIALDVRQQTAQVAWQTQSGTPRKFELYRQVGDSSQELIFQTDQIGKNQFDDAVTRGNLIYNYMLRNYLDHDVVLDSRTMQLLPYLRNQDFDAVNPVGAYVAFAPGQALGQPMLMLIVTQNEISLQRLNFFGKILPPVVLDVPHRQLLKPTSLSLAVTPIGHPRIPRLLVAGILPDEKRIQLSAFSLVGNTAQEAAWDKSEWKIDDLEAGTAMAVTPDGTLLVIAGTVLKFYILETEEIRAGGEIDLGLPESVVQVAAFDEGLWVVLQDGSTWRCSKFWDAQGIATSPMWTAVAGVNNAVGVGGNGDVVYLINGQQRQIQTFDFEGRAGLWWDGMDDLDLSDAALSISLNGDVYLRGATGRLAAFQHFYTSLKPLSE